MAVWKGTAAKKRPAMCEADAEAQKKPAKQMKPSSAKETTITDKKSERGEGEENNEEDEEENQEDEEEEEEEEDKSGDESRNIVE